MLGACGLLSALSDLLGGGCLVKVNSAGCTFSSASAHIAMELSNECEDGNAVISPYLHALADVMMRLLSQRFSFVSDQGPYACQHQ